MDGGFDVLQDGGAALVLLGLMEMEPPDALILHGAIPYLRQINLVGQPPHEAAAAADHALP